MKILLSHRYFWPDTSPYATMLRSIAARLAREGHDVTVFSSQPSYHASTKEVTPAYEEVDGFKIIRMPISKENKKNLPIRVFNVFAYAFGLRRHILKNKQYDIVVAASFPPIFAAKFAQRAANKIGAKFIYHFQDIHPEVSLYSKQLKKGRIFNFLQNLDSKTCRNADALIVLSSDMANTLKERANNKNLLPHIVNNFQLENFGSEIISNNLELPKEKFTILFAGNIGRFQNLNRIIEAAYMLVDVEGIQFWFMGEGVAKKALIEQAGTLLDKTVFFLPFQHHSVAQELMGQANLNLVSLAPNIYRVAYPSKTLSILACSSPILATIEEDSELGTMVVNKKIGYVADQLNPQLIANIIRKAYDERELESELRDNVKQLYKGRFDKDIILDKWCEIIEKL